MCQIKIAVNMALPGIFSNELFLMAALPLLLNWSARFSAASSWLSACNADLRQLSLVHAGRRQAEVSVQGDPPQFTKPYGKMFVLCCHEPTILGSEGRRVFSLELTLLAPLELFNFCFHYKVIYSNSSS